MPTLSTAARNAAVTAVAGLADAGPAAGVLKIYTAPQPAGPDTTATGTLLASATLADPAFGTATTGAVTLTDPASVTGVADGTAAWFRIEDSTGTGVLDGTCGTTGADLILNTTTISTGVTVDIQAGGTLTMPAS